MKFFVLKALMFFDFFYKRKTLIGLKKLLDNKEKIIFDVGAHNGESIIFFNKNFNLSKIYTFEPLQTNFLKLKINTKKIAKKIVYFNCALGEKKENRIIKEMTETSSSTLNDINESSKYFKKKKFFLGLKEKQKIFVEKKVSIDKAKNIIKKFKIEQIDLLKIDTEGYEFNVIKGFGKNINLVKVVIFEHHYDLMITKNYTFRDINKYLVNQGFNLKYKFKMPFRKTFEYIYAK
jgi:FkbM family methyltransferase